MSIHRQLFQEQEKISLFNRDPHESVGCKQNILPHLIVPFQNSLKSMHIDPVLLLTPKTLHSWKWQMKTVCTRTHFTPVASRRCFIFVTLQDILFQRKWAVTQNVGAKMWQIIELGIYLERSVGQQPLYVTQRMDLRTIGSASLIKTFHRKRICCCRESILTIDPKLILIWSYWAMKCHIWQYDIHHWHKSSIPWIYCFGEKARYNEHLPKTIPVETQYESALRDGKPSDIMPISENDIAFNRKGQSRGKIAVLIPRINF
jgi:hypothetical protein